MPVRRSAGARAAFFYKIPSGSGLRAGLNQQAGAIFTDGEGGEHEASCPKKILCQVFLMFVHAWKVFFLP